MNNKNLSLHDVLIYLEQNGLKDHSMYRNEINGEYQGIHYTISDYSSQGIYDHVSVNRLIEPENSLSKPDHSKKDCYSEEEVLEFILHGLTDNEKRIIKVNDAFESTIREMRNALHENDFDNAIKKSNELEAYIITIRNLKK